MIMQINFMKVLQTKESHVRCTVGARPGLRKKENDQVLE